jgi:hypothetical protein
MEIPRKPVLETIKKLKIHLPYYPAIPLQDISPKESKPAYNRDTESV